MDRAVDALRVEPASGALREWFKVRYRSAKGRPLVVYRWAEPARVQEELAEARDEYLAGRTGRGAVAVRKSLSEATEVAAVELGLVPMPFS